MATVMTAPIKIRPETKAQIEALKLYHRETIDEVIQRLIERQREPQEGEPAAAK